MKEQEEAIKYFTESEVSEETKTFLRKVYGIDPEKEPTLTKTVDMLAKGVAQLSGAFNGLFNDKGRASNLLQTSMMNTLFAIVEVHGYKTDLEQYEKYKFIFRS